VAFDKEHIRQCIPFAFQLERNAAQAAARIRCALDEGADSYDLQKFIQVDSIRETLKTLTTENSLG